MFPKRLSRLERRIVVREGRLNRGAELSVEHQLDGSAWRVPVLRLLSLAARSRQSRRELSGGGIPAFSWLERVFAEYRRSVRLDRGGNGLQSLAYWPRLSCIVTMRTASRAMPHGCEGVTAITRLKD
jgi:hypothetical protein